MARLLRAVTFIVLIFVAKSAFTATTHYISKSLGSDKNNGTSKSTPWAHLPGMPSCSNTCHSYSPIAGDQFILNGGDSWVAADLSVEWTWNGTNGNPIYIGVDQTWYNSSTCGSSWCRPIFNCQATQCGNPGMIDVGGSYVTIDNIELTGLRFVNGTNKGVQTTSDHTIVEHIYMHGWSHDPSFNNSNDDGRGFALDVNSSGGGSAGVGVVFHDNVVDGQDTSQDMMGGSDDAETVYHNVFRYVYNCIRGNHTYVYGNLCEYIVSEGWPNADHANGISIFSPWSGTTIWDYNNVIRHDGLAPGSETHWVHSLGDATGNTSYVYNNIQYDVGRGIDTGDHPPASGGTFYIYNNIIVPNGDHCMGNGESPPRTTLNYGNNQCINTSTLCDTKGVTCNNLGGNLSQTTAQASTAGYTSSESYAYSPTSASSPTVGAGNNLTSACSGNVTALCSDTTYATYNTSNHTVALRTANTRPGSGAWDVGAFQFSSSPTPQPPTNLKYTVQ